MQALVRVLLMPVSCQSRPFCFNACRALRNAQIQLTSKPGVIWHLQAWSGQAHRRHIRYRQTGAQLRSFKGINVLRKSLWFFNTLLAISSTIEGPPYCAFLSRPLVIMEQCTKHSLLAAGALDDAVFECTRQTLFEGLSYSSEDAHAAIRVCFAPPQWIKFTI